MSDEVRAFNPVIPTVTGFFGAITFATMILLMQFPEKIQFAEILIPATASISFFFIITTISGAMHESYADKITKRYKLFVKVCFIIGYYGLILLIPALVYSFSPIGAVVILAIEIIVSFVYSRVVPKIEF